MKRPSKRPSGLRRVASVLVVALIGGGGGGCPRKPRPNLGRPQARTPPLPRSRATAPATSPRRAPRWPPYLGKYRNHSLYLQMSKELPALRKRAIDEVSRLLDVTYDDDHSIWLRFADATDWQDASRASDRKRGRLNLKSRARTSNLRIDRNRVVVAVTFYLEHYIGNTADYRTTIVHEFSHALMRKLIPDHKVRKRIPGWFKEGLATLIAGQGPLRVRIKLASNLRKRPSRLAKGLARLIRQKRPSGSNYWEYYLHTRFIQVLGGPKALARLYRLLMQGTELPEAIAKVCGIPYGEFVSKSDAYARKRLADVAKAHHWEAYRKAVRILRRNAWRGVKRLRAFLATFPESLFVGPARTILAKQLARRKRHREAIDLWQIVLRRHLRDYAGARHGRLYFARSLAAVGEYAEARRQLETYLRDMVWVKKKYLRRARRLLRKVKRHL